MGVLLGDLFLFFFFSFFIFLFFVFFFKKKKTCVSFYLFLVFFFFACVCFIFERFFTFGQVKGNARDGRSRHQPTNVFEFVKLILRP